MAKKKSRRSSGRIRKSPADMAGRRAALMPGAGDATFNPSGGTMQSGANPTMMPGNTDSRAPTGPQNLAGSRAAAAVPTPGQGPTRYNQIAGQPAPTSISDVDLGQNIWSPFQPVVPFGPPYVNYPRAFDYPVGLNLDFTSQGRLTFFKMLQVLSRTWGILRSIIETRKDQLMRIPWDVQLVGKPKQKDTPRLKELRDFFKKPDRENNFNVWMRMQLEDRFVIDAANYYVWKDRGGKPYAAMQVAGETIKPLIDDAGMRPVFPNPCFQQLIKGLPWENLDSSEFLYAPQRRTRQDIYGYSEVQQIYIEVLQGIKKMLYKLSYWDEGNIPQLMITVPSGWTPEQLAMFQAHTDILLGGNIPFKSRIRFMPSESKPFDLKNANGELLKTEEDEWVTRLVCYTFSVSPQPFVRQMNRATAESAMQEAEEEGLHPLMNWVKEELIDPLIQSKDLGFGYDDCEFVWQPEPEVDAQKQMTVLTGFVKVGMMTPDEGREQINMPPYPGGAGSEPVVITPNGPIPFAETLEANKQKALAVPDQLGNQQEMHDQRMDQMQNPPQPQPGKPPGAPGNGKAPPQKGPNAGGDKSSKEVGKAGHLPFGETCEHDHHAGTAGTRLACDVEKRRGARRLAPASMERPAAVRAVSDATRSARAALRRCGEKVATQIRRANKLAKAYPRPGDPDFDPDPPVKPPPDPVDPASVAAVTFDLGALSDLEDDFGDALADAATDAATTMLGQVGLDEDEDIVDRVSERAVKAARAQAAELVSQIDDTTRGMLRDVIADALEDNVGLDGLVDRLMESAAFGQERAELIARTEVRDANERGVLEGLRGARDAGNVVKKEWLLGSNPCPICEENADAGPIDLDDEFPSGDTEPTAHPNCECAVTGVIENSAIEQLARFAKSDVDVPRDNRGRWTSGGGSNVKLTETNQRAFAGSPVSLKTSLSKQEAGALGEKIAIAYLRDRGGIADARPLNSNKPNYPVDVQGDHRAIEVKTGLVSNSQSAQQWRATIGEPGKEEQAWLRTASAEDKAAWNAQKSQAIIDRKNAVVRQLSREIGRKVRPVTVTILLNPDKQIADVHVFDGFHARIGWKSEDSKAAYVGSFRY